MRRVELLSGVLGAALAAFAAHSADAAELPDGPNRALVAAQCGACHDLQPLFDAAAAGVSREDWSGALEEMTGYGLKVTPEQREQILEYLATYLGPSAKK
jgi:mono/diheme cytochrome c family protein